LENYTEFIRQCLETYLRSWRMKPRQTYCEKNVKNAESKPNTAGDVEIAENKHMPSKQKRRYNSRVQVM